MLLWKVTFKDGSSLHLYANSRHQVETEALTKAQRIQVFTIRAVVRNPCDDRTNPWEWAGLSGHKDAGQDLELERHDVPILS